MNIKNKIAQKPWLLIVAGCFLWIGALIVMLVVAVKHQPQIIALDPPSAMSSPSTTR